MQCYEYSDDLFRLLREWSESPFTADVDGCNSLKTPGRGVTQPYISGRG